MKTKGKPIAQEVNSPKQNALERFGPLLDASQFKLLLAELQKPLIPSIRLNPLKADKSKMHDWAKQYGWEIEPIPFCSLGWRIRGDQPNLGKPLVHRFGQYYIQEAASMLPPELFDEINPENALTLDLAASPGGKTTHLTSLANDKGLVLANDSSTSRLTALKLVLNTFGTCSTSITNFPGEYFGAWFPVTFDRVLLDAPCSMQGLRTSENHPMRQISDRERGNLAQRQQRLLESALQAAKIGGQVVYSTCTLETEENESVLDAVLRKYPGTFKIQSVTHKLPGPAPALYADHLQEYRPEVRNAIRLWPHVFQTAGFFAALLEKTNQIPTIHQSAPTRAWDRSGLKRVPANVLNDLEKLLQDQYGFFLKNTLADYGLSLWLRGITLIALPDLLISHFFTFPVVSAGLTLGEFAPYGFLVSHDWATRFESQMKANRIQLQPEFVPAWLRGEDLREFPPRQLEHGGVLFMEDTTGRFLGRARAQKDRLKNLLPRRLTL